MSTVHSPRMPDALDMLEADHRALEQLFDAFDHAGAAAPEHKQSLVQRACELLTIHAIVEEELLYPMAQDALAAQRNIDVDEAYVEHFLMTSLIDRLVSLTAGDDGFDTTFRMLKEHAGRHVAEEEATLFPELRRMQLDLVTLGARMSVRRDALRGRIAETAMTALPH